MRLLGNPACFDGFGTRLPYDGHAKQYAAERAAVRSRFYEHVDDGASARLFDALRERTAA